MNLTEKNRAFISELYAGVQSQDTEILLAKLDPDVVIHEPPFLSYGGVYHGIDGFKELFPQILGFLNVFTIKVDSIVADGENVIALLRADSADGESEIVLAESLVIRNEKIVEIKLYFHDTGSIK